MPLIDHGQLYRRYDQRSARLGRHLWLDARSLAYMVENSAETMSQRITSRHWQRAIPILDQGQLGSCTGNAGTGALGTEPFYGQIGDVVLEATANAAPSLEQFAVRLYSDATRADPVPGTYPPDDTGSSGLAVCKVLRARHTINAYRWARTAVGFAQLLQAGPVLMGMPWFEAFFEPDRDGFIDWHPQWAASDVAGGHEVEALGIDVDARDLYSSAVVFANSWGTGWGDAGFFRMRLRTYEQLTDVDLKQFVI